MKWIAAAAVLMVAVIPRPSAHAAAAGQTATHSVNTSDGSGRARAGLTNQIKTGAAPQQQVAANLRVPDSAFVPAIVDRNLDGPADNQVATAAFNAYADVDHPRENYGDDGRITGWYQQATFGPVTFDYIGSVFDTNADAQQSLRSGLTIMAYNDVPATCSNVYHVPCFSATGEYVPVTKPSASAATATPTPTTSSNVPKQTRIIYEVAQYNQCLIEARGMARDDIFDRHRDTIIPTLAAIRTAALQRAAAVCPNPAPHAQINFSIVRVRAETFKTGAAYNLTQPGLHIVQAGTPVNLAVYFNVSNGFPNSTAIADFTVSRGSGVSFFYQSRPMHMAKYPDTLRITTAYTPKHAGMYHIMARVAVDGVAKEQTVSLKVVPHLTSERAGGSASRSPATKRAPAQSRKPSASHSSHASVKQPTSHPSQVSTKKPALTPAAFSLPASVFPPGTHIVRASVASNTEAQTTAISFLSNHSLAQEGRVTGYYVNTMQSNKTHPIFTQYLVSIFHSSQQAGTAFSNQRSAYIHLAEKFPREYIAVAPAHSVGDQTSLFDHRTSVNKVGFHTLELGFTRGAVYVQVAQSFLDSDKRYEQRAFPYMFQIASRLDAIAQHGM